MSFLDINFVDYSIQSWIYFQIIKWDGVLQVLPIFIPLYMISTGDAKELLPAANGEDFLLLGFCKK